MIYFGNKNHILPATHTWNNPFPKFDRHHLRHITTKAVYPFSKPEPQDIEHLLPCVRHRIEMSEFPVLEINAIIQLNRFVPVILAGMRRKAIVTGHFGWKFTVFKIFLLCTEMQLESLSRQIVKVIVRIESKMSLIILSQILHKRIFGIGMVLPGDVVRHKVNDNF